MSDWPPFNHWRLRERTPEAVKLCEDIAARPFDPETTLDVQRVSGLVVCEVCGREYYAHPHHPFEPCLTVTCEGRIVKL